MEAYLGLSFRVYMNLSNQIVKTLLEYVLNSVLLFLQSCKSFHLYSTLPLTERAFSLHLFRVDSQIAEQFCVDLLDNFFLVILSFRWFVALES